MSKARLVVLLAVFAIFVPANLASATVDFDTITGTGFVGKGDVQAVFSDFGWNDRVLQENAPSITFTYVADWSYTVVCTGASGSQTLITSAGNFQHVTTEARRNPTGKATGFDLLGWESASFVPGDPESQAPQVGDACGGGTIPAGTLTSVAYNDDRVDRLFVNVPNFASQVVWQAP